MESADSLPHPTDLLPHREPFLLLDEITAHLDQVRRRALFDEVLALGAQAWLTGTEAELFGELAERAQFFRVRDAEIVPTA